MIERVIDTVVKTAQQALLLVWESDLCYLFGQRYLKNEESKNQKNSMAKKNYLIANSNSGDRNDGQSN